MSGRLMSPMFQLAVKVTMSAALTKHVYRENVKIHVSLKHVGKMHIVSHETTEQYASVWKTTRVIPTDTANHMSA